MNGLRNGDKVFILSNDRYWKDSTIVDNDIFRFKLTITSPGSYSIRLSRDFEKGKWWDFYIDKGALTIENAITSFWGMHLSGSPYTVELNSYFQTLFLDSTYSWLVANTRSIQDVKKRDSVKLQLAKRWIKNNRQSVINPFILETDVKRYVSSAEIKDLLYSLPKKSRATIFGKDIQIELEAPQKTAIGKFAPKFTQADTSGNLVSLVQFKGRYTLLDFWASWCVPCRAENPNLKMVYEKFKNLGFTVLGISLDKDKKSWLEAIRQDSLNWTHISDLNFWANPLVKLYGVHSVPANFLIDPNGKIIAKDLRGDNLEQRLSMLIK